MSICTAPIYKLDELNNLFIEMTSKNCNQRCSGCYIDFPISKKIKDFISIDKVKEAIKDLYKTLKYLKNYYKYEVIINDLIQKFKDRDNVKGNFTTDPKHPNQYFLDLDFRFKNGTFLKAGKTLLTLAFGLTNSQEEIIGDSELIINDIRIDKQQLYKLLSL